MAETLALPTAGRAQRTAARAVRETPAAARHPARTAIIRYPLLAGIGGITETVASAALAPGCSEPRRRPARQHVREYFVAMPEWLVWLVSFATLLLAASALAIGLWWLWWVRGGEQRSHDRHIAQLRREEAKEADPGTR
jgi:hypothetical protein